MGAGSRALSRSKFVYQPFFNAIAHRPNLNLPANYYCAIEIAGQRMYDVNADRVQARDPHSLDKVFSIADRRMRITLTPLPQFLQQNRRYLPEFALVSGTGITLLLGPQRPFRAHRPGPASAPPSFPT